MIATLAVELRDGSIRAIAAADSVVGLMEQAEHIRDAGEIEIGKKTFPVRRGTVQADWKGVVMKFECGNKVR